MNLRLSNEAVWALTPWMDSAWLAGRIARATIGVGRDVQLRRLSADRIRRVHLVEADGRKCVVELSLRRDAIRAITVATTTATEHGLCVARLLGSAASASALVRYGAAWAVFEYVEGRHPSHDGPIGDLDALATTYAELHSVESARPGLGRTPGWTLDDYLSAWNAIIGQSGAAPDLAAWLARHRPDDVRRYQLVHGDANRGNAFLRGDGRAVLIDLGVMQFALAPLELVYLLLNYCNRDEQRRAHFVEVYRKQLGERFDSWEKHGPFWLVGGFLERARWRLRSAGKRRNPRKDAARLRDASDAVASAGALAARFPDGRGALDRVLAHCWETRPSDKPAV